MRRLRWREQLGLMVQIVLGTDESELTALGRPTRGAGEAKRKTDGYHVGGVLEGNLA
jgi:hypothetical protein